MESIKLLTGSVAELLGVRTYRLAYLTTNRIVRPDQGPSGHFEWTRQDILAAAEHLGIDQHAIAWDTTPGGREEG